MRTKITALILVGFLFFTPLMTGVSAGSESCNPKSGIDFCIINVDSSTNKVQQGDSAIITTTIRNVGNQTGTAVIILGIQQPEGGYTYAKLTEVNDLEPGASKEIDLPIRMLANGAPGPHRYNVMLFDPPQQYLYDSSGYYQTIVATENTLDVAKWIQGVNNFARALIAIAVIVGALLGKKFL